MGAVPGAEECAQQMAASHAAARQTMLPNALAEHAGNASCSAQCRLGKSMRCSQAVHSCRIGQTLGPNHAQHGQLVLSTEVIGVLVEKKARTPTKWLAASAGSSPEVHARLPRQGHCSQRQRKRLRNLTATGCAVGCRPQTLLASGKDALAAQSGYGTQHCKSPHFCAQADVMGGGGHRHRADGHGGQPK